MSKVFIGVGHGGSDSGAVGYLVEKDVNLNMAIACKNYLEANGVEVMMSRYKDEEDSLNEEARECNAYSPDLAIDVHNNAGGGDGFEVYHTIYGGVGKALAENIENEVIAIGQNSRGIKTRQGNRGDYYGFIRMTKCPAVITEGVFVDNKADASQADELYEQEQFGIAYAKGILKTLGIVANNQTAGSQNSPEQENKTETTNYIANYQKAFNSTYGGNLVVDNIKGVKTNASLQKVCLKKGMRNELVRWCQDRLINHKHYYLKDGADGIFGSDTERVVKQFQKDNGLVVDGIIGIKTISILF